MGLISDIHFLSSNKYKTVKRKSIINGDFLRANYEKHPLCVTQGVIRFKKLEEEYVKNIQHFIFYEDTQFKDEKFILDFLNELTKCSQPSLLEKILDYFGWNNSQSLKEIDNIVRNQKVPKDFTIRVDESDTVFLLDFKGILDYFFGIFSFREIPMHIITEKESNIFTELNKVDPFDDKSVIKFAKCFGLPSGQSNLPRIPKYSILFTVISKKFLLIKFIKYKNIFDKFISFKLKISNFKKSDAETLMKDLQHELETQLNSNISFKVVQDEENGLKKIIFFKDFFHLAYNQITDSCSIHTKIKKCEFCNNYFVVTHKSQKFCPALLKQKRSSCEIAFYNWRKKVEKKE